MSPHIKIDTLILSDIHLGSPVGKARQVISLLKKHRFRRLILLGDIMDNSAFDHLDNDNLEFLSLLKMLSAPKSGHKVIWISGNHDRHLREKVKELAGIAVREQYVWKYNHKRFLAVHGDQFDGFIEENARTDKIIHHFFLYLQNLDRDGRHLIKYIDKSTALMRRLSKKVAKGAIAYAKENRVNAIFCGHTHVPMQQLHDDGASPIHYVNVGCWTHTPSTFAVVDNKGEILLEKFA